MLSNVTTVLATVVAMVLLDWRLAAFALVLLPLFVLLTKRVGEQRRKVTARAAGLAGRRLVARPGVAVRLRHPARQDDGASPASWRSASRASRERLADLEVRSRMTGRWMMAAIQMTFAVMPALVYWFAGWTIARGSGAITIGTLVAFTTLQTRLFFPIGSLLGVQIEVQSSLALFDRIFEYLDQPIDIVEGTRTLDNPRGEVRLDHVWFRYDDDAWTLKDVSFDGARRARRPRSWARRARARRPAGTWSLVSTTRPRGRVTIDGVDVRELTFASLAAASGSSRRRRISSTRPCGRTSASRSPTPRTRRWRAAARAAQIHDLIASLPEGYDTVVGERGYRFSGGEKQRMAIARTMLRNPPILVLDEATSALDTQTERLVQEALERLSEGRTTIAIAHRLSTVRDADQIVVLDGGRVVETGTHDELLAAGGRYSLLVARDADSEDVVPELA